MTNPATSRLFIALWPDDALRAGFAAWRDAWHWPKNATPVRTDRLHVTLHFLGDVETARIPELADALAKPFEPFTLSFGHNALWPHGIAVLEPDESPRALLALHATLGDAIDSLGLPRDARPYKPHVTLARRAAAARAENEGPSIRWQVNSFALMQSAHGYTAIRSYP